MLALSPVFSVEDDCPLAPALDLGVDAHLVPVLGVVPPNLVLSEALVDLDASFRLGEVDKVYMLVSGPDVLKLHPRGAVKLKGVFDVRTPLSYQLDLHAGLLQHLAHGRVVWKFVSLDMATRG